jgi:hypothetical protein
MKTNSLILAALQVCTALVLPWKAPAQGAYSSVVSNDAPVLYWNFNETDGPAKELMPIVLPTTLNDLSPSNTASRISHSSLGSGLKLGNAASLLVGDFFFTPNLAVPTNTLTGPWAIEFWIQVQGSTEFQRNDYLLGFGPGGNFPGLLYDYVGAAAPRSSLELFSGGNRTGTGPLVSDLNWHHVLYVYYGDGVSGVADQLDIYLDGTIAAQGVRGTFSNPISLTQIAVGTSTPAFAGPDGFEGNLDEVAIYDLRDATDASQVTAKAAHLASSHYALATSSNNYSQQVLSDGPFLYWNFNEDSGSAKQLAPIASAPVQNDLTPNVDATRVAHSAIQSGLDLGNAAHFPTAGGYFSIGALKTPAAALAGPWLIEFWMRALGDVTGDPRFDYLFNFGNNAPAVLYDYNGANPNGGLELFKGGLRTGSGPGVEDNAWHHVLFAFFGDGSVGVADRLDVYFDGTNAFKNIRSDFTASVTLAASLFVGSSTAQFAAPDGFQGDLDELAIYDLTQVLTEAAVEAKASDIAARHYAAAQGVPALAISRTNDQIVISWKSASGYFLTSSPILVSPTWSAVGTAPTIEGGTARVIINLGAQNQYFRLVKQQ